MEETVTVKIIFEENNEELSELYTKVVEEPNLSHSKGTFIKCPECSEEILMIPTLKAMHEAIENHVKIHKEMLKTNPLVMHGKSMNIRLNLAQQVLLQASNQLQ